MFWASIYIKKFLNDKLIPGSKLGKHGRAYATREKLSQVRTLRLVRNSLVTLHQGIDMVREQAELQLLALLRYKKFYNDFK